MKSWLVCGLTLWQIESKLQEKTATDLYSGVSNYIK